MSTVREKVSYLQGLTHGLNVDRDTAEGKLLLNIVDVLEHFADELDNVSMNQQDMEDYMQTMDEDLTDLEQEVYCEEDEDDDDADFVEVECPNCHEPVHFEADVFEDDDVMEVTCPNCGEVVYENTYELEDEDEDYYRHTDNPGL